MAVGGGSGANGIRAGRAYVEIGVLNNVQAGLRGVQSSLNKAGSAFLAGGAVLGGFAGGAYAALDKLDGSATERAAGFDRLAKRIGSTTEKLSEFAYVADLMGVNLDRLGDNWENWGERIFQGSQGVGEAFNNFQKLGFQANTEIKTDIVDQMFTLMDRMNAKTADPDERRGMLSSFFSDKGQHMNELFGLGSDRVKELMAQGRRLGATVFTEDAKAAREVQAAYHGVETAVRGVIYQTGLALMPSKHFLNTAVSGAREAAVQIREWVGANGELIQTIELGVYGTLGLAAGFVAVGASLKVAGAAFGFVMLPIKAFYGAVGLLAPIATGAIVIVTGAWSVMTGVFAVGATLVGGALGALTAANAAFGAASVVSSTAATGAWGTFVAAFAIGKSIVLGGLFVLKAAVLALPLAIVAGGVAWLAFSQRGRDAIGAIGREMGAVGRLAAGHFSQAFGATFRNLRAGWSAIQLAMGRGDFDSVWRIFSATANTEFARIELFATQFWNRFQTDHLDGWKTGWQKSWGEMAGVVQSSLNLIRGHLDDFGRGLDRGMAPLKWLYNAAMTPVRAGKAMADAARGDGGGGAFDLLPLGKGAADGALEGALKDRMKNDEARRRATRLAEIAGRSMMSFLGDSAIGLTALPKAAMDLAGSMTKLEQTNYLEASKREELARDRKAIENRSQENLDEREKKRQSEIVRNGFRQWFSGAATKDAEAIKAGAGGGLGQPLESRGAAGGLLGGSTGAQFFGGRVPALDQLPKKVDRTNELLGQIAAGLGNSAVWIPTFGGGNS
jgi:hypothetical protein